MENQCIVCGKIIPEGRHICLACGDYDDQQRFRPPKHAWQTNGDRVRAMNNAELASLICELAGIGTAGKNALLAWLESEAKST